ncbi:MAG: squalene--hopene cyclase, partial [Nitrosomonadaceae bacterium]
MTRTSLRDSSSDRTSKIAADQQPDSERDATTDVTALENALTTARTALVSLQKEDGHWCFPLEADCTIPSEYILMMHFMDDVDVDLEVRLG